MKKIIVVREPKEWNLGVKGLEVVSKDYLTDPRFATTEERARLQPGAQLQLPEPGLLREPAGRSPRPEGDPECQDDPRPEVAQHREGAFARPGGRDPTKPGEKNKHEFIFSIYFGRNVNRKYDRLAHELYKVFQAPLMRARFVKTEAEKWELRSIKAIPYNDIPEEHLPYVKTQIRGGVLRQEALRQGTGGPSQYDLAILVNPEDKAAPEQQTRDRQIPAGAEQMGFAVDIIGPNDIDRIAEYDALLIRENTHVNDHTYRFARKAQSEGWP
jgi:hypothetical protein